MLFLRWLLYVDHSVAGCFLDGIGRLVERRTGCMGAGPLSGGSCGACCLSMAAGPGAGPCGPGIIGERRRMNLLLRRRIRPEDVFMW